MRRSILCVFFLSLLMSLAYDTVVLKAEPEPPTKRQTAVNQIAPSTGEQIFTANCGRCHVPPMSISPRVTGTVIMHMRVRARLSRQEEQLLLKYISP